MKIIHLVLGKANPLRMNGVNKVAYELARTQHAQGQDVAIWGITTDLVHNYPDRSFSTQLFLHQRWGISPKLRQAIDELGPDTIVHIHGVFIPVLDKVAGILQRRQICYIVTPHGALSRGAMSRNNWKKRWYYRLITERVLRRATVVQMLGEAESEDFFTRSPDIRQILVPNGQNLEEVPDLEDRSSNARPLFGFCGRLDSYHKGLDILLQALKKLVDSGVEADLLLIGDGEDRDSLISYCNENQLAAYVNFTGAVYGEEKYQLLHKCDFFVHTSRMEGFPVAVLEAAALGLPPITTPPTSMNRFLRRYEAGIPIKEVSAESAFAGLQQACKIFEQLEHERLRRNARWMIKKAFNWEDICGQLIRVYQRHLSSHANSFDLPQSALFQC